MGVFIFAPGGRGVVGGLKSEAYHSVCDASRGNFQVPRPAQINTKAIACMNTNFEGSL
jgi:hypothetical protein